MSEDIRKDIRDRLQQYHLTFTWLIAIMELKGLIVDKFAMSAAMAGTAKGPKADSIINTAVSILDEYEQFVEGMVVVEDE